jgi:hypothetical protein
LDCSDEEVSASVELCRALIDLDPDGRGVPTGRLFDHLGEAFPRHVLDRRLKALMTAGAIEKQTDKLYELDVRLGLSGSLGLVLIPLISTMSGQRALLEMFSRAQARAATPGASADEVRADLDELRRVLIAFANGLRRIVDSRDLSAMIEQGREIDDQLIRARIEQLRKTVEQHFAGELVEDLEHLAAAAYRYVRQQVRLLRELSATRGGAGHWLRRDEVYEVLRYSSLARLAALWDGIVFDEAPMWLDAGRVVRAAEELTFANDSEEVPEAAVDSGEVDEPSLRDALQDLADRLLAGANERDLTELLLRDPWPAPAVLLARLSTLAGLDVGYTLEYQDRLAISANGPSARVASAVALRRIDVGSSMFDGDK